MGSVARGLCAAAHDGHISLLPLPGVDLGLFEEHAGARAEVVVAADEAVAPPAEERAAVPCNNAQHSHRLKGLGQPGAGLKAQD